MKKNVLLSILIASPLCSMNADHVQLLKEYRTCQEMALVAAAHGKTDWLLILRGATGYQNLPFEPNEQGVTPFYIACQEGHSQTVEALLALTLNKHQAQVDLLIKSPTTGQTFKCTPLHIAAAKGHTAVLEKLFSNCNERNYIAIEPGAQTDRYRYITNKININWTHAPKRRTPLHLATANGHVKAIAFLLSRNAKILLPDSDGITALDIAGQHPNPTIFEEFQKHLPIIATIRAQTSDGIKATVSDVKQLIAAKIDIERVDPIFGSTALIWAVICGNTQILRVLLDAGANPYAKDNNGWTAEDHARYRGYGEMCDILTRVRTLGAASKEPALVATTKKEKEEVEFLGSPFC